MIVTRTATNLASRIHPWKRFLEEATRAEPMMLSLIFFFRQSTLPARCIPFIARIIEDNVSAGSKHPSNTLPSIDDTILLLNNFEISNFPFTLRTRFKVFFLKRHLKGNENILRETCFVVNNFHDTSSDRHTWHVLITHIHVEPYLHP